MQLLRLTPSLLVMGVIFCLSHTPGSAFDFPSIVGLDKLCHFSIYALLAASFLWAFPPYYRLSFPFRTISLTILLTLLYGCLDEFHQSFVPLRSPDIHDIIADTLGALFCCFLWLFFLHNRGRKEQCSSDDGGLKPLL